jgi:hypothetical protein
VGWLADAEAGGLEHAELERRLQVEGRDLLRRLLQDHLDLRAHREQRIEVADAAGVPHHAVEAGHARRLATVFGPVVVSRLAYRRRGHHNLHPGDAALNLPAERHSHGLRRLAATEAARGSYAAAVAAIRRATGQTLGKRQTEQLILRAATDFDNFYTAHRRSAGSAAGDLVVLSVDGKGVVMRPDALRPATAKAANTSTRKLATRLSKGEKRNRKRMAEVGAVYHATPVPRTRRRRATQHRRTTPGRPRLRPGDILLRLLAQLRQPARPRRSLPRRVRTDPATPPRCRGGS